MPRRIDPLEPGTLYHIYNRGHNRSTLFRCDDDYLLFLRKVRQFVPSEHLEIWAYALMPNHYHFLARVVDGDAATAMGKLGMSFSKIVNKQYERIGATFQGAYRAKPVERDDYALHLSKYIHLNPVRAGLVERPEDWVYSSYRDYAGLRFGTIPRPNPVLDMLCPVSELLPERQARYVQFVADSQPEPAGFDPDFD